MKIIQHTKTYSDHQYVVNDTYDPNTCFMVFPKGPETWQPTTIIVTNTSRTRKVLNMLKAIVDHYHAKLARLHEKTFETYRIPLIGKNESPHTQKSCIAMLRHWEYDQQISIFQRIHWYPYQSDYQKNKVCSSITVRIQTMSIVMAPKNLLSLQKESTSSANEFFE